MLHDLDFDHDLPEPELDAPDLFPLLRGELAGAEFAAMRESVAFYRAVSYDA
jgi:hypothetical protein